MFVQKDLKNIVRITVLVKWNIFLDKFEVTKQQNFEQLTR